MADKNALINDRDFLYGEQSSCSNGKLYILLISIIYSYLGNFPCLLFSWLSISIILRLCPHAFDIKINTIFFLVRVDCTQADMLITFIFGEPFEGRVYATGNPQACFEVGNGQPQLVLRVPLGTQCGTVQQGRGRYINHVVVQQNPVIMQQTDRTVRVECSFDASEQTVAYSPGGSRGRDGAVIGGGGISVT